ncbi:hypothetical protein B0T09DRAFT_138204 [Sordaria sp. MPI-SDFR-AT-0083]|nr:hypothetical protein B0T09DRAFT_138204 [Sordaria sp. MPI-SDFR-AT-0083]
MLYLPFPSFFVLHILRQETEASSPHRTVHTVHTRIPVGAYHVHTTSIGICLETACLPAYLPTCLRSRRRRLSIVE